MPTGYTAPVQSGEVTNLRDYAMQCARAFGALITLRDEPADAVIPEKFEPRTDYHDKSIADAEARITELIALTPEQAELRALEAWQAATTSFITYAQEKVAQRERYEAMAAQVEAWKAPTEEHTGLRDFMLEQLRTSIDFDCSGESPAPERLMGEVWLRKELESARWNLDYHTERRAKEIASAADRTRWVAALRASLL